MEKIEIFKSILTGDVSINQLLHSTLTNNEIKELETKFPNWFDSKRNKWQRVGIYNEVLLRREEIQNELELNSLESQSIE